MAGTLGAGTLGNPLDNSFTKLFFKPFRLLSWCGFVRVSIHPHYFAIVAILGI